MRLIKIDGLIRRDHYYLEEDDDCYYLLEYFAHQGYSAGPGNQLISNLKKSPLDKGKAHYRYKGIAIRKCIAMFRNLLPKEFLNDVTLVPMPPSKSKDHEEYDDRIVQILEGVCRGHDCDLRELINVKETQTASHATTSPRVPLKLERNFDLDDKLCSPVPNTIIIFDDVITTGAHFKAAKSKILKKFPQAKIHGVFITRRVIEHDPGSDFEGVL